MPISGGKIALTMAVLILVLSNTGCWPIENIFSSNQFFLLCDVKVNLVPCDNSLPSSMGMMGWDFLIMDPWHLNWKLPGGELRVPN